MLEEAEATDLPGATPQDELRLLWARARIDAHDGDLSDVDSEPTEAVAEGFLKLARPKTFAESATEIASILAQQGRWEEALRLAGRCAEWFDLLGLT